MEAKGKKILIVEDEKPLSRTLNLKLTSAGFEVAVADNGAEGLEMLAGGGFDLVILDLMMPQQDGFHVLKKMQEDGDTTPVVVMSNLSQPEDERRAKELGAKEYFIKSNMSLPQVVERVAALLSG